MIIVSLVRLKRVKEAIADPDDYTSSYNLLALDINFDQMQIEAKERRSIIQF
jgi:hypothetical protein